MQCVIRCVIRGQRQLFLEPACRHSKRLNSIGVKTTVWTATPSAGHQAATSRARCTFGIPALRTCQRSYSACCAIHASACPPFLTPNHPSRRSAIDGDIAARSLSTRDKAARVTPSCLAASVTVSPNAGNTSSRRVGREVRARAGAGAGLVLDDEAGTQGRASLQSHQARQHVHSAARAERHDVGVMGLVG